jgi:putative membrane protein
MMHWSNFGGMGTGGYGFGWIFMVLFWTLVVLGVAYLMKQLFGVRRAVVQKDTAEDVLKRMYASGKLSKDEYQTGRDLLSRN